MSKTKALIFSLVLGLSLVLAFTGFPIRDAGAFGTTNVTVGIPVASTATVIAGSTFTVNINIDDVTDLTVAQFDLSYDSAVIQVIGAEGGNGVTPGSVGGVAFPISMWAFQPAFAPGGVIRVLLYKAGLSSWNGTGYLAQVHFNVVGTVGQTTTLQLSNMILYDFNVRRIQIASSGGSVTVAGETGPAVKLAFVSHPAGGIVGAALNNQPAVVVQDSWGNTVVGSNVPVTLSITPGTGMSGAILGGTATMPATNGVAIFTGLSVNLAGSNYTLTATSNSLVQATSNPFNVRESVGPASKLAFVVQPGDVAAGSALAGQVAIQDDSGNLVMSSTAPVTFSMISGPVYGTILGTQPIPSVNGLASLNALSINVAGTYALMASSSGLTSATTGSFVVCPGPPAKLEFYTQPDDAYAGRAFSPQPRVFVGDLFRNPITSSIAPITLAISPGSGSSNAKLSGITTVAAVNGLASFYGLSIDLPGFGFILAASSSGLPPALSRPFDVHPASLIPVFNNPPTGEVGIPYSFDLTVTGGVPPLIWTIASGTLCPGLTFDAAKGRISGVPMTSGIWNVVVSVTDSFGQTMGRQISVKIVPQPEIAVSVLPDSWAGVSYRGSVPVSGGVPPFVWSVQSGIIPIGLSLDPSAGVIYGIPTTPTSMISFTAQVIDSCGSHSTKTLSMRVLSGPAIITSSLPSGKVDVPYSATLEAGGGNAPYSWSIEKGKLPSDLVLSSNGVISGTPKSAFGSAAITFRVTDRMNRYSTKTLSFGGVGKPTPPTTVTTTVATTTTIPVIQPPTAKIGTPYYYALTAGTGAPPYTWSLQSGNLPTGLILSQSSGVISGIPVAPSVSHFTVRITDSLGAQRVVAYVISVVSNPTITTPSPLPVAEVGVPYSQTLSFAGCSLPCIWTAISLNLPPGLHLDPNNGVINGVPETVGVANVTFMVTDSSGNTAIKDLPITVLPDPAFTTDSRLPDGYANVPYLLGLTTTGGTAPYTFTVVSGMPIGLCLDPTTGIVSGTPTIATSPITVRIMMRDAVGASRIKDFVIAILSGPVITTGSLPAGRMNIPYSQTLTAAGGTPSYIWSIQSGTLPSGLSLDRTTGIVSGIPTSVVGPVTLVFKVIDHYYRTATVTLTIAIN